MKPRLTWVAVAVATSALLMSACSKSDSNSSSNSNSTAPANSTTASSAVAGDPALAQALTRVNAALKIPTDVGVTVPLSKKPATGKKITYLSCGVGICQQIAVQLNVAAKALGWTVTAVAAGTTPEQTVAAWDRALATNPDAILTSGTPVVVYQHELDTARQRGIPVVDWASANPPNTPGIIADINPVTDNQERGRLLADYAATQSAGKAKTLFLDVPDYPTLAAEAKAYEAETKAICSGCSVNTLDFAATDIGTKVPSAVVSYLQTNPGINWICLSFDDMGVGVSEALKAAGLASKIKIIGQSSNMTAAQSIKDNGGQVATIPQGVGQMAFKTMDVLARHFNGESVAPDKANLLPIWIQTNATIGDPNDLWKGPAGYEQTFEKLWKVSA